MPVKQYSEGGDLGVLSKAVAGLKTTGASATSFPPHNWNLSLMATDNMTQSSMATQETSQSPFMDSLPPRLKTRVMALQAIQHDKRVLDAKLQREIQALEKTYWIKYGPLFQRRFDIITGNLDPSQGQNSRGHHHGNDGPPGIPDFWLTAMNNHPDIGMRIEEDDEAVLRFLTDIRVENGDSFDFSLVFHFAPNPYFSNLLLRVKFFYQEEFMGEWPDPLKAE